MVEHQGFGLQIKGMILLREIFINSACVSAYVESVSAHLQHELMSACVTLGSLVPQQKALGDLYSKTQQGGKRMPQNGEMQ